MSQHHYNAPKPAFGKMQGTGVAMPRARVAPPAWSTHNGASQAAASVAVPQAPNYADIVGDAFTGRSNYGGDSAGKPVKGLRFLSGIIDFIVIMVFAGILGVIMGLTPENMNGGTIGKFYFNFAIICFIYGFGMEASTCRGTVGKVMTGTVIVNKDGSPMSIGKALGRNLAKGVSMCVPFYIPYLMVLWTRQNQSLHDLMAGTLVYKKGDVPQSYAETFA